MYRSSPPTLGTGTPPLRISGAARRVFDEQADSARHPAYRTYLTDMVRPFGLAVHTEALGEGRGQSYGDMADALIAEVTAEDQPTDLLVMAFAVPDVTPWRCTAAHLSHMCPGNPMAFAVSDCGTTAAFTGLRLIRAQAVGPSSPRALLIVTEQAAINHELPIPASVPARHAAVALRCDQAGPGLVSSVRLRSGVTRSEAAGLLATGLAELSAGHDDVTVIAGAELAQTARLRRPPSGGRGDRRAGWPALHRRVVGGRRTPGWMGRARRPAGAGRGLRPAAWQPLPRRDRRRGPLRGRSDERQQHRACVASMTGDVVEVWLIRTDLPGHVLADLLSLLDDGERERARALAYSDSRRRFIAAHGAFRVILGRHLGVPPASLRWHLGPHGKPELAMPGPRVSFSHSGDFAALATAPGRRVGVDIQQLLPRLDVTRMAARFYPRQEAEFVASAVVPARQVARFTRLWARKEAYVKVAGGRLLPGLEQVIPPSGVVVDGGGGSGGGRQGAPAWYATSARRAATAPRWRRRARMPMTSSAAGQSCYATALKFTWQC